MKCALCGHIFDADDPKAAGKCSNCPLSKGCKMICCPKCGYSTPLPRLRLNFLKQLTAKSKERKVNAKK
jgi:rubredoxin